MADAVEQAIATGEHLLVQAGTGTGKSLGYLAPALTHLVQGGERVIVATATLALQAQLATSDVPTALDAVAEVTGQRPSSSVLKGRTNHACLLRVRDGVGDDQSALFGGTEMVDAVKKSRADAESVLGAEVVMLREWVEEQVSAGEVADRDDAPSHTPRAWAQVSIPTRECLGVQKCPYGAECLVEASRERARRADLVVTNHALLAIDAMHGHTVLPEHDLLVIDEAHELVSRVTGAASAELSPQLIERVGRRILKWVEDDVALDFLESADELRVALDDSELGRLEDPEHAVIAALRVVRDTTRGVLSAMAGEKNPEPERAQAQSAAKEVFDIAERMCDLSAADVIWTAERERAGRWAQVAPLSVAGLMRERVLSDVTTVLTSATLTLGGSFDAVAGSIGLQRSEQVVGEPHEPSDPDDDEPGPQWWRGLDVGSPFDYRRQGILYVASDLPNPGRDGIGPQTLARIAELVWASGGRTLGLFASQRAAELAAAHVRSELPALTVLCQGDAQLSELTRRFIAEPDTSLFGTVSLWQGIDVPGETCQLVIIDKIPFPRPDDPLLQARQRAVSEAGGNGFMTVAATHAGLLLAQGSGRLIRRHTDRGVVAVLDPRLVNARYGSFLRASLPGFWPTRDAEVAVQALRRLAEARAPASSP